MCDSHKKLENSSISPQCQYFVVRKKRLCRMTVKPGKQYCGEHAPQPTTGERKDDTRIPCPNDPKHTCYASKLEKHLSICNARQQEQPGYIIHNVNAPASPGDCPRLPLAETPLKKILQVIDKVNTLYDTHIKDIISTVGERPIHGAVLAEFSEAGRTESSLRHLRQASSLLHVVEREGLVANNTAYVELGAGKGHLSYYAWYAWCQNTDSQVLLVDRASLRHKRDNKLKLTKNTHTNHVNNCSDTDQICDSKTNLHKKHNSGELSDSSHNLNDKIKKDLDDNDKVGDLKRNPNSHESSDNLHNLNNKKKYSHLETNSNSKELNDKLHDLEDNGEMMDSDLKRNSNSDEFSDKLLDLDDNDSKMDSKRNRNSDELNDSLHNLHDSDEMANGDACDVNVHRIRADLAHLSLERVPAVRARAAVVGYAKHLCGAATDLALRCICSSGVAAKVRGAVVASCCHHRCERAAYPANAALLKLGIDAEDFNTLLGIVSWATCGDGRSRDRRNRHKNTQDTDNTDHSNTKPHDIDTPDRDKTDIGEANPRIHKNTRILHKSDNPAKNYQENRELNVNHNPEYSTETNITNSIHNIRQFVRKSDNPNEMNSPSSTETRETELGTKNLNLSQEQRQEVGRRAKALLDWGRVLFLRERGFRARLVHYVPSAVSPENLCIVATKLG